MCLYKITHIRAEDDEGKMWLLHSYHFTAVEMILTFIANPLFGKFVMYRGLRKKLQDAKKLMSAEIFKSRIRTITISENRMVWYSFFFIIIQVILMPYGMAMQVFGVKEEASWPSPFTHIFARDGSPPQNLLGNPVHALIQNTFMFLCYAIFFNLRYPTADDSAPSKTTKTSVAPSKVLPIPRRV